MVTYTWHLSALCPKKGDETDPVIHQNLDDTPNRMVILSRSGELKRFAIYAPMAKRWLIHQTLGKVIPVDVVGKDFFEIWNPARSFSVFA